MFASGSLRPEPEPEPGQPGPVPPKGPPPGKFEVPKEFKEEMLEAELEKAKEESRLEMSKPWKDVEWKDVEDSKAEPGAGPECKMLEVPLVPKLPITLSKCHIDAFDGEYKYDGEANGKPHWVGGRSKGQHLYWVPNKQQWLLRTRFSPTETIATAYKQGPLLHTGESEWNWSNTTSWIKSPVTISQMPADEAKRQRETQDRAMASLGKLDPAERKKELIRRKKKATAEVAVADRAKKGYAQLPPEAVKLIEEYNEKHPDKPLKVEAVSDVDQNWTEGSDKSRGRITISGLPSDSTTLSTITRGELERQEARQCNVCLKPAAKKCPRCETRYCSKQCQQLDWTQHKRNCSGTRKLKDKKRQPEPEPAPTITPLIALADSGGRADSNEIAVVDPSAAGSGGIEFLPKDKDAVEEAKQAAQKMFDSQPGNENMQVYAFGGEGAAMALKILNGDFDDVAPRVKARAAKLNRPSTDPPSVQIMLESQR